MSTGAAGRGDGGGEIGGWHYEDALLAGKICNETNAAGALLRHALLVGEGASHSG